MKTSEANAPTLIASARHYFAHKAVDTDATACGIIFKCRPRHVHPSAAVDRRTASRPHAFPGMRLCRKCFTREEILTLRSPSPGSAVGERE